MPPQLRVEINNPENGEWVSIPGIQLGDRDGTVSDNTPEGRDIYLFGVDPIENQGYIKRSTAGIDTAGSSTRLVDSAGFVTVAALQPEESFELTVKTDTSPKPRTLRFTYLED